MARSFDVVDDVITLATEVEYSSTSLLTFHCWAYPTNINDYKTFANKRTGGTATWFLRIGTAASANSGRVIFGWTAGGTFQLYTETSAPIISANVWTSVADRKSVV